MGKCDGMNKNDEAIYQLTADIADLRGILTHQLQTPTVTGKAAAFVALAKDSRVDGRIGVGDITVSVLLAAGGFGIGVIGAAGIKFGNVDIMSTGEIFSYCTMSGCTLGLGRLMLDALAVPLMLSNILDWLEDRWNEWLETKQTIAETKPQSAREIPVYNRGEPAGFVSMPEPTEFNVNTLKIKSVNIVDGIREIAVDKVCFFLKTASATGQWARDKQNILSQKEHPDVKQYLQGRRWWEISSPLALRACVELRAGVTNGTERTNERQENETS